MNGRDRSSAAVRRRRSRAGSQLPLKDVLKAVTFSISRTAARLNDSRNAKRTFASAGPVLARCR
jgi:hypothetical protein